MNNFSFDTKSKRILTYELIFEKSLHFWQKLITFQVKNLYFQAIFLRIFSD